MSVDPRADRGEEDQHHAARESFRDAVRRGLESGFDPVDLLGSVWGATVTTWRQMPRFIQAPALVVTRVFRAYAEDRCNIYGAAIAYYSIFSFIPLLIIMLAATSVFVPEERVVEFLSEQFALDDRAEVEQTLSDVVRATRNLSLGGLLIGAVALAWSASGVFSAVRQGLNTASHEKQHQSFFRGKLVDFAVLPLLGALIFFGLVLNSVTQALLDRATEWEVIAAYRDTAWRFSSWALAAFISLVFFFLIYRFVPSQRPSWKEATLSAICASVLFELTRLLASTILDYTRFTSDTAVYAGLTTALVFLFIMRIVGSIVLVGAEFGRVVTRYDESEEEPIREL